MSKAFCTTCINEKKLSGASCSICAKYRKNFSEMELRLHICIRSRIQNLMNSMNSVFIPNIVPKSPAVPTALNHFYLWTLTFFAYWIWFLYLKDCALVEIKCNEIPIWFSVFPVTLWLLLFRVTAHQGSAYITGHTVQQLHSIVVICFSDPAQERCWNRKLTSFNFNFSILSLAIEAG